VYNDRNDLSDDFWGEVVSEIRLADHLPAEALDVLIDFSYVEQVFVFDKALSTPIVTGSAHPGENTA